MLKKKSGEREAEEAARAKALETLRERCNDLEVQYNRACCREQERAPSQWPPDGPE